MRELDRKCSAPNSAVAARTVRQLAAQPLEYKEEFLLRSTFQGLRHLVRCALEAQVSADTTSGHRSVPMACIAIQYGATHALKVLLAGGANKELADINGTAALGYAALYG